MTWIIKAPKEAFPYACHPKAEIFAPEQSDAYRFKSRERAKKVAAKYDDLVVVRLLRKCPIRGECPRHGFVHGREAEELRAGIEEILRGWRASDNDRSLDELLSHLQGLLDDTDARDSLAFIEQNDPCTTRAEGK